MPKLPGDADLWVITGSRFGAYEYLVDEDQAPGGFSLDHLAMPCFYRDQVTSLLGGAEIMVGTAFCPNGVFWYPG